MRIFRISNKNKIALAPVVILRCVLPQWDLRFPSYKCLKKDIFSRYILTPTKFNCTLGHAQILGQTPKKTRNLFLQWDFYDEIPYPETRFDTDFTQICGPN